MAAEGSTWMCKAGYVSKKKRKFQENTIAQEKISAFLTHKHQTVPNYLQ